MNPDQKKFVLKNISELELAGMSRLFEKYSRPAHDMSLTEVYDMVKSGEVSLYTRRIVELYAADRTTRATDLPISAFYSFKDQRSVDYFDGGYEEAVQSFKALVRQARVAVHMQDDLNPQAVLALFDSLEVSEER